MKRANAFPAADHTGSEEFRALGWGQTRHIEGMVGQEFIEFGDKLLELAENQETGGGLSVWK
jgi:hypothetical protein